MPWLNRQQEPLLRTIAVLRRALYLAGKEKKEAENGLKMLVQVYTSINPVLAAPLLVSASPPLSVYIIRSVSS